MGCCCSCSCLDPPDEWQITDEIRKGERGAGWLYKKGQSRGNWTKRYFVLTDFKLLYFTDETRLKLKGEIVLVGASVKSSDKLDGKKKYHFSICHPRCGTREFYAVTNNRREQWLNRLTDILSNIERSKSLFGPLLKKGGLSKSAWQERWCVLAGSLLDYYENYDDSLPKGTIDVSGAKIREYSAKDQKYCFEIVANGRKGMKKYSFCAENASDRKRWMDQLKRVTDPSTLTSNNEEDAASPMHKDDATSPGDVQMHLMRKSSARIKPSVLEGYLMKKSPSVFQGWQQRYFAIVDPGEIHYYDTV